MNDDEKPVFGSEVELICKRTGSLMIVFSFVMCAAMILLSHLFEPTGAEELGMLLENGQLTQELYDYLMDQAKRTAMLTLLTLAMSVMIAGFTVRTLGRMIAKKDSKSELLE